MRTPDRNLYGSVDVEAPKQEWGGGRIAPFDPSPDRDSLKNKSLFSPAFNRERDFNTDETVNELEKTATIEHIDSTIDLVVPMAAGADIIRPYRPQKWWLWKQWHGTVFEHGMKTAILYMVFAAIVSLVLKQIDDPKNPDDYVDNSLGAFNQVWKILLTLTTFILTFFLNQSLNLWRQVYNLSRSVQGRTNDFGLLAATHAARGPDGQYTPNAKKLLEDISMAVRLIHIFCYATKTRTYRVLHTNRALRRMVERDVLSQDMLDAIQKLEVAPANRLYAMIEWIIIRFRVGVEEGTLKGGAGFEQLYLEKGLMLRSQYGTFADVIDARIPLAYVHFVQVMVDIMLICSPFALYKDMGIFSVFCMGVLTLFFSGLLDLSKVMLDPFDNEDYCDGVIDMNIFVFIRESNNGSVRFLKAGEHLPSGWLKAD